MQRRSVSYGKLVRDRIPEIITAKGKEAHVRTLQASELFDALVTKLGEEAAELRCAAPDSQLEELADLREVLSALITTLGYSEEQVEQAAREKRAIRGGFRRGVWLDEVSWLDDQHGTAGPSTGQ
ncbi:nucleoside triphosphate pyrophosphohydrolase [Micromonospora sp. NPDC023644]|uniref:nucleoside triphosphate pyrophosphohydrolase n=1 Tax=Micromonospora sp. NPDC023644 TaxID=3154321 RepID=UPI0033C154D9